MRVIIAEFFWQHTEVIGTWLDYFCRVRGDDVTVFYPAFLKTPHNYIHIWAQFYKFTFNFTQTPTWSDYELCIVNTPVQQIVDDIRVSAPALKIIAVGHYEHSTIGGSAICNLPLHPFCRSAATAQPLLPCIPICAHLAGLLADRRSQLPPAKKIMIIGNSFKEVPATAFNALTGLFKQHGYSLTTVIYGYNDISGSAYNFEDIQLIKDATAIELYKQIEEARFVFFLPSPHHFFNRLSGSIPLSLLFGRPLITTNDVLRPYNLKSHYDIFEADLLNKMENAEYYAEAQRYLCTRLNEILAANERILEQVLGNFGLVSIDS